MTANGGTTDAVPPTPDSPSITEAVRGPEGAYHQAVEAAQKEDVGEKKPADEAQAEDEDAEEAES